MSVYEDALTVTREKSMQLYTTRPESPRHAYVLNLWSQIKPRGYMDRLRDLQ